MNAPKLMNEKPAPKPSKILLLLYLITGFVIFWAIHSLLTFTIALTALVFWTIVSLGLYYWEYNAWNKATKQWNKNMKQRVKDMKKYKATAHGSFGHVSGLSLPENLPCKVFYTPTGIEVLTGNQHIKIPHSKIVDINIKTDTEIQKHLVSTVDGAVFGSYSFGRANLGIASIGNSIKEGKTQTVYHYLIIFYKKLKAPRKPTL